MSKAMRNALLIGGLAVLAFAATGCDKLRARDHLNKGVQAFKAVKYPQAIEHFKEAVRLDPEFENAQTYLGMAYFSQYIPGAESPENAQNAQAAKEVFLKVLEKDPKDTTALATLASLHYNQAHGAQKNQKLDEAKEWYERLAQADPNNKEAYYSLGVIAWSKAYPARMTARAKLGMKPEEPGPVKDKKVKEELKAQWMPVIDQGIQSIEKSLDIDKEYDDAMAYMNLLIRERADLADSPEEYKKDADLADTWVQRSMETKKIKAERVANKGQQAE